MRREKALKLFAQKKLNSYTLAEREEELTELMCCNWSSTKGWETLPEEVKAEFTSNKFQESFASSRYDDILIFKIIDDIKGVRNEFIRNYLNVETVIGEPYKLAACPCCGYCTLEHVGVFEICKVCWWEDDGQDNETSDEIYSGANEITLTQARCDFLVYGIYNSKRIGLIALQKDRNMFYKKREFKIEKKEVVEVNTNWRRTIPLNVNNS